MSIDLIVRSYEKSWSLWNRRARAGDCEGHRTSYITNVKNSETRSPSISIPVGEAGVRFTPRATDIAVATIVFDIDRVWHWKIMMIYNASKMLALIVLTNLAVAIRSKTWPRGVKGKGGRETGDRVCSLTIWRAQKGCTSYYLLVFMPVAAAIEALSLYLNPLIWWGSGRVDRPSTRNGVCHVPELRATFGRLVFDICHQKIPWTQT